MFRSPEKRKNAQQTRLSKNWTDGIIIIQVFLIDIAIILLLCILSVVQIELGKSNIVTSLKGNIKNGLLLIICFLFENKGVQLCNHNH